MATDTKYLVLLALLVAAYAVYHPRRNPNGNRTPPPSVSQMRSVNVAVGNY